MASARAAAIMIHGRGATAESILDLVPHLGHDDITYVAPQASGNTWYPNSFLAPLSANSPFLKSALRRIELVHKTLIDSGFADSDVYIVGFSQGACLGLEYAARNGNPIGGVIAFSGGLIGNKDLKGPPPGDKSFDYPGSLDATPVFIGCSDNDPHVPQQRIDQSEDVFRQLNANTEVRIYPGMGHTVNNDELSIAKSILAGQGLPTS